MNSLEWERQNNWAINKTSLFNVRTDNFLPINPSWTEFYQSSRAKIFYLPPSQKLRAHDLLVPIFWRIHNGSILSSGKKEASAESHQFSLIKAEARPSKWCGVFLFENRIRELMIGGMPQRDLDREKRGKDAMMMKQGKSQDVMTMKQGRSQGALVGKETKRKTVNGRHWRGGKLPLEAPEEAAQIKAVQGPRQEIKKAAEEGTENTTRQPLWLK